jgi:outer membrane protein assembly factor BamD (BamD/ComL family)
MKINLKKTGIIFIILTNIVLLNSAGFASPEKNTLPKYVVSEDEKFNKTFREGRDLIDKEEWKKAAEKFKEIACDCPEDKYVDAALYWLAFCYKKQKSFDEMDKTLDILLRNYPSSSWADDARVMKYEQLSAVASTPSRPTVARNFPIEATATTLFSTVSQTPLEREDEIKLAAFQSLFSANTKRAIEILGEMLQGNSKASETLKREVVRSLRSPKHLYPSEYGVLAAVSGSSSKPKTDNLPQLRETLFKGYQTEPSVKVKTEIIYALGNLNDGQSATYIAQLYASEQNKELKKAIINSFGGYNYFAFASSNSATSKNDDFEKLFEIIRTEKDSELRQLALSNLRKFSGWSAKNGVIEMLTQMFDSENDDEFKLTIIRTFASTKENTATTKLLNIAKNDKSDKMRLEAIRSLRTSDNPEVLKFLEDLIK